MKLTQEYLKSILSYNHETGHLTWINPPRRLPYLLNTIAGCKRKKDGYMVMTINNKQHSIHRIIWLYVYGEIPEKHIDHINHDRSDNRIENLRKATKSENQRNRSTNKNNSTGSTGVYKRKCGYEATITVNSKLIYLGLYKTKSIAIAERKKAENKYNFHSNHGKGTVNEKV